MSRVRDVEQKSLVSYLLRSANESDKSWLDNLRRTVYRDLFFATWGGWDEDRHARHFSACWEEGNISLIEVESVPVGMFQIFETDNTVEISEIQIFPDYQGKGLATEIINDVLETACESRKKVTLSTGLKNSGALRLYQKIGFVETSRTDAKIYMEHP